MPTQNPDKLARARERLRGPVAPLKIPFTDARDVDYSALESHVDWLCQSGVPILLLTYGTTEFVCLTEDELDRITDLVGEVVGGRAMYIASTDFWPVDRAVRYIEHARDSGADAVKVQLHWKFPYGADGIVEYHRQVIEAVGDFPLLAYTDFKPGMSVEILQRLLEFPSIIGMKNDSDPGDDGYIAYLKAAAPQIEIMSGGTMRNVLTGWPHGARSYLCAFAPILPRISLDFYSTLQTDGVEAAQRFVSDYEDVLFAILKEAPCGWQPFARALMQIYGQFPSAAARPPYSTLSADTLATIRAGLIERGLLEG